MSNPFYVSPTDQVALARVKSADINNLDAAVDVAFDAVNTAMALKASSTGQTWTGAHDFGGASSVIVPTPTLMAQAVNKAYADALIAAATAAGAAGQLPSQSGNAGKFLKTDGAASSWAYAGISTINSTVTTSTTLTGTYLYVPVAMTALGQAVTLPSALTLSVGGPQYVIDNTKGGYPVGIRDNTGTLIMAVAAGGEALVSLKDNTTQAGVWSVTGSNLEPGLITIDSTFSSTYSSTVLAPFVALDNNTSIHFAALSSGFAAFVVDNTGKVISTPVTVDATASSVPVQAFKISTTSAIVFYASSSSVNKAVVLTLSGTSPSYSLAVGTATASAGAMDAAWGGENFTGAPKIVQLSSSLYLAAFTSGSPNIPVIAYSVSGSTITSGATSPITVTSPVANSTTTYALTATTALVLYKSGASAPYANNAVVVSVTGATCTIGTPAALTNCASSVTATPSSAFLSATKVLVADDNNTTNATVIPVTITGTTVTAGTALNVETATIEAGQIQYTVNSATRYNPHLWATGTNTAGLWYLSQTGISRVCVLTESSGTVTAGTILYNSISYTAAQDSGVILPQGTSEFLALKCDVGGSNTVFKFRVHSHKVSGSTITSGVSSYLDGLTPTNYPISQSLVRLSSGDYLITNGGNGVSAIPVIRTNGDSLNVRGYVRVPMLIGTNGAKTSVASNRVVLTGSTQYMGNSGSTTAQLRLINVEIAA